MSDINNLLTEQELYELDILLKQRGINEEHMALEAPRSPSEPVAGKSLLVLEQEGRVRLSRLTRRLEMQREARLEKRRLAVRRGRKRTSNRGRRHHKSKAATLRRRKERQWCYRPFDVIVGMDRRKCKDLDRDMFMEYVYPLWEKYDSRLLSVQFPKSTGIKKAPWTVLNMKVVHRELGTVFDGEDLQLWLLSGGGNKNPRVSSEEPRGGDHVNA